MFVACTVFLQNMLTKHIFLFNVTLATYWVLLSFYIIQHFSPLSPDTSNSLYNILEDMIQVATVVCVMEINLQV
jgi:hypothetical protein